MAKAAGTGPLIEAIYEGPVEAVPFHGFLATLRVALAADYAVLTLRPPTSADRGLLLIEGSDRRWESAYQERFVAQNPFIGLPRGKVTALADLISEDALLASDFYRDYMQPSGTFHVLGVDMREPDGLEARLRATRRRQLAAFGPRERGLCQRLVPHLQRAVRLHARFTRVESERNLFEGAVEHLAAATILLDERGKLLRASPRGAELLRQCRGLLLVDGKLSAEQHAGTQTLRRAIERALAQRAAGTASVVEGLRLPVGDGTSLRILVRPVPLGRWSEGHAVAAIALFIGGHEDPAGASPALFRQLFDLTGAEAALAAELAGGRTLDEASEALGVTRNTARTHLRAIFAKTGVARQSELVRLLLRSTALA